MNEPAPHVQTPLDPDPLGTNSSESIKSLSTEPYIPAGHGVAVPPNHSSFGDYELIAEIARGGMGVVFKARHLRLNRLVALKLIRSGDLANERELKRFRSEAEAAARLDHPGIVPVYEVGEHAGQHFYSMAFVEGQSLNARIRDRGPLDPRSAAAMLRTIAEAVQAAHDCGIVHRDIKPHNVLLDHNGQPRVTDFGIAKHVETASDLTLAGQVMGTPSYMPPEQASGNAATVGPAADVYSLGATLYCMLTGRPPFQASGSAQVIQQVLEATPVPPRQLNPEVPPDLETICLKCLRKEADKRYASARELADDLGRFLAGEPIRARPVRVWERGWKFVRRRPVATALAAVSVLAAFALVAAGVSLAYQMKLARANDTLQSSNDELDQANTAARVARDVAVNERDSANRARALLAKYRYASDATSAGRAWREGDIGRMSALLTRLKPAPGEDDLRGFEWYYLRGLDRHDVWKIPNTACSISPNGKLLAMVSEQDVQLFDSITRQFLRRLPNPTTYPYCFAFSGDSRRFIVPASDGEVAVWDVERGVELQRLKGDDLIVASVSLNHDGTLATASGQGTDHSIRLWDVATGKQQHRWVVKGYVFLSAFSRSGEQLAFRSGYAAIDVYDLKADKPAYTIAGLAKPPEQIVFHPTENWLIVACGDDGILFWSGATGQRISPPVTLNGLTGSTVDFSPDGKFVLTGVTRDNSVRLWDGATGKRLSSRKGHMQKPIRVGVFPDGRFAWSQALDATTILRDMSGNQELSERTGSFTAVRHLRYSPAPGSRTLAFLDERFRLHLFDGETFRPFPGTDQAVYEFEFNHDGKELFTVGQGGGVDVWDLAADRIVRSMRLPGHVGSLAVHPSGKWLATAGSDFTIRVWDAANGTQLHDFPAPRIENTFVGLTFQPGTDHLIAAHAFDGLQLIHLGDSPHAEKLGGQVVTSRLAVSPDGSLIATAGPGNAVTVWSFPGLEPVHVLPGHSQAVLHFQFSADGRRLATTAPDQTLRLWDLASGQEVLTLDSPGYYSLAMSSDGERIATAGQGGTIRIWEAPRDRE